MHNLSKERHQCVMRLILSCSYVFFHPKSLRGKHFLKPKNEMISFNTLCQFVNVFFCAALSNLCDILYSILFVWHNLINISLINHLFYTNNYHKNTHLSRGVKRIATTAVAQLISIIEQNMLEISFSCTHSFQPLENQIYCDLHHITVPPDVGSLYNMA